MEKEKKADKKGRFGRTIKNNLYAIGTIWDISKARVVHTGISIFLGYFEWVFYSAFFMYYVINAMSDKKSFGEIMIFLAITVAVFSSISIYQNFLEGHMKPEDNVKVYHLLYRGLFRKSRNVELECFENEEFYNRYTLAMDGAAEKIIKTLEDIWGIVLGGIAAIVVFLVMYRIDAISILFVLFPIIGNFVFDAALGRLDYKRNKEINPHNRRVEYVNRVMYLSDYAKEVRLSGVFHVMKRIYEDAITGMIDVTRKYTAKGVFLHWMRVMFTFNFIFEGVLLYGAYRTIVTGTMSLASLAVLSSVMVSATWILIGFADHLVSSYRNGLFVENLRSFMEYEEKIPEDGAGKDPGEKIHKIEFVGVSFSYKKKEVIHDLSFVLEEGKSYAMVGHNGAGKSTIIKLLLRLYDPTEGQILLNGTDIRDYELKKYRALFATAFQDFQIFSMSVAENVLMHKVERGDQKEQAKLALKRAGVWDKVQTLPKGMDTILTREFDEEGAVLSGGEFQKIVVARAFAASAPFKIFDEPSSALDPIAEHELFRNMMKDGQDKTMLFISHRLSSVQSADYVFMLENGGLIEEGTHNALLEQDGKYCQMYHMQAKNYLADDSLEEDGIFASRKGARV